MKIQNKQVEEIFKRWTSIYENENLKLETRLKAFSIMKTIEALVVIYELGEHLDEEVIDDLFIKWNEKFKPLLPEERDKLNKINNSLRKSFLNTNEQNEKDR